ncbi:Origin recognition complex subunit 4 [Trichoplax sp. H2]|nr:Origin recognition complex subunit 4 [Trichoplax sp. H2]|eukprot:RDD39949.1 Origin recognition complex subunit 4 [Trichoplax sp. H2]
MDYNYSLIQSELRNKICHDCLNQELIGLQDEQEKLLQLLRLCTLFGESNSILIIEPPASGKTMLIRSAINKLRDTEDVADKYSQVNLNGLIQVDDKLALISIGEQLGVEDVRDRSIKSFGETFAYILESYKNGNPKKGSIIFILDVFDLFTRHRNQALLYNLFEVCQSAKVSVLVIGVTCRLDVLELLEKRVKSRFSHRQIYLLYAPSFDQYVAVFKSLLKIEGKGHKPSQTKSWNNHIEKLANDGSVNDILRRLFDYSKDLRLLKNLLVTPVCLIHESHPNIVPDDIIKSCKHIVKDYTVLLLQGVSVLELSLIIAMKHLSDKRRTTTFTFEMVYQEYMQFILYKSQLVEKFPKPVIFKAYERLIDMALIKPTNHPHKRLQKEYWQMSLLVQPTQIAEALQKYPNCPTSVMQWALNPIHS